MASIKSNLKVITSGAAPTTEKLLKGEMAFGNVGGKNKIYANNDGSAVVELVTGEPDIYVVQSTGTSTEDVMSQKAVTDQLAAALSDAKTYTDEKVTSVYKYKGSVASYSALPATGQVVGDVWNVIDTGKNYAWEGTEWDDLGGVVDLSDYYTKTEADAAFVSDADYVHTDNNYTTDEKNKVATIVTDGDGTKFHSDNGTYQTITLAVEEI